MLKKLFIRLSLLLLSWSLIRIPSCFRP